MTLAERCQLIRAAEQCAELGHLEDYQRDEWQIRGAEPRMAMPSIQQCRADGCGRRAVRKYGLCHMHAARWLRTGSVEGGRGRRQT